MLLEHLFTALELIEQATQLRNLFDVVLLVFDQDGPLQFGQRHTLGWLIEWIKALLQGHALLAVVHLNFEVQSCQLLQYLIFCILY